MKLPRVDMDRVDMDMGMMVPPFPKKWLIVNNLGQGLPQKLAFS